MAARIFIPTGKFKRDIKREFILRTRDRNNYTQVQLNELVEYQLHVFNIDNQLWYLAKDITSYLGISPNNSTRSLQTIDQNNVREEHLQIENNRSYEMHLLNELGIRELLRRSNSIYVNDVKNWLENDVFQEVENDNQNDVFQEVENDNQNDVFQEVENETITGVYQKCLEIFEKIKLGIKNTWSYLQKIKLHWI